MSTKIWQVFGPNTSDDPRVPDPYWGIYQGEYEVIVDWMDANHPGFRDHLEGRKFPKAGIREIIPKVVSRELVEKLVSAKKRKAEAEQALREMQDPEVS